MINLSPDKAIQLNSNALAFVGDAVFTLFVRGEIVNSSDAKTNALHNACNRYVKAVSQSKMYEKLLPLLTEAESEVGRRARNTHTGTKAKNAGLADYKRATSLEAIIGYLYLTGQQERLNEILSACKRVVDEEKLK